MHVLQNCGIQHQICSSELQAVTPGEAVGCWRRFLLGSAGLGDLRPVKPQTFYEKVTPKLVF